MWGNKKKKKKNVLQRFPRSNIKPAFGEDGSSRPKRKMGKSGVFTSPINQKKRGVRFEQVEFTRDRLKQIERNMEGQPPVGPRLPDHLNRSGHGAFEGG